MEPGVLVGELAKSIWIDAELHVIEVIMSTVDVDVTEICFGLYRYLLDWISRSLA